MIIILHTLLPVPHDGAYLRRETFGASEPYHYYDTAIGMARCGHRVYIDDYDDFVDYLADAPVDRIYEYPYDYDIDFDELEQLEVLGFQPLAVTVK